MLKQRVLTAVIALPLLLLCLLYGGNIAIYFLVIGLVGLATHELAYMLLPRLESVFLQRESRGGKAFHYHSAFCIAIAITIFTCSVTYSPAAGRGVVISLIMVALLVGAFIAHDINKAMSLMTGYLVCIVVGVFPWLAVWDLVQMGPNSRYAILVLAIVWCGDTGAYFGGRFLGRHKLAPKMSPKKTWEGAIAGLLASQLGGMAANAAYGYTLAPTYLIVACALLGAVFGQMGDLAESTLKRFAGVKDSGTLFPGHGGILDRADALLFAAPVTWLVLYSFL